MTHNYQWGFVGIDECPACDSFQELWFVSAVKQNEARCARCQLASLEMTIQNLTYEVSTNGSDDPEHLEVIHALKMLRELNPLNYAVMYGERVPNCAMCFAVETDKLPFIDALNNRGELVRIHAVCSHKCENCEKSFARAVGISWRLARRLDIINRHSVELLYLVPEDEWQCRSCISTYIDEHGTMSEFFMCNNCDSYDNHMNAYFFNDQRYCENCFNDNVYDCNDCSERYWADDGHDCSYDDDDYCGVIHNYDYRPRPIFFGHQESRYFLGFELEVEAMDDNRSEGAQLAQNYLQEHAYMKSDGSLNDGFEIVTHPHTLEAYKTLDWSVLDRLRSEGFRSWNTDTCGLHVHISRTAFGNGDSRRVRDYVISRQMHELRFMKLIYDNQRQVERLAGRQSNHYASFMDKGRLVRKVKDGSQANGRYSVINTDNNDTIEVRIFRGSLRKERVMSALEFVTASVEYTRNLKVNSKNGALTWTHFVAYVVSNAETYPNLLAKMNESFDKDQFNSEESYA